MKKLGCKRNPIWVDADGSKTEAFRFMAEMLDFLAGSLRLEESMVDERGDARYIC